MPDVTAAGAVSGPPIPRSAAPADSLRASAAIAAVTALVWHAPSLWRGFFRFDDFAFLHANGGLPLRDLLLLPHNEHVLPLWRLEVAALDALFGINPLGWIVVGLATFAVVLVLAQRLLLAWGVGAMPRALAVVIIGGWTQWGEVLTGYFTLVLWLQVMAFAGLALLLQQRVAVPRPRTIDSLLFTAVIAIAPGFGEAALWVPMAVLVVAGVDAATDVNSGLTIRAAWWRQRWPLGASAGSVVAGTVFYVWALTRGDANALHVSAASTVVTPGTRATLVLKFLADLIVAPWRVIDSAPLPDTVAAGLRAIVIAGTIAALGAALWRSAPPLRRAAIVCMLVIGVHAVLVTVGRPFAPSAWPAKHIGVALIFFAMLVAIAIQATLDRPGAGRFTPRAFVLVAAFYLTAQLASETFAMRRGWPDGRREGWVLAERRRAAIAFLRDSVVGPIVAAGIHDIPDLPAETLARVSSQLESYDLAVYDRFVLAPYPGILIVREPDEPVIIPPGADVVNDPFAAAGPALDSLTHKNAAVRRLYGLRH